MTEPKKIKTKKKEEQPFGMEKLRRLAEESRSFEEYMEKVIPELLEIKDEKDGGAIPVPDYTDINVSDKVVKIIQSYTGVVNKMVWRKY